MSSAVGIVGWGRMGRQLGQLLHRSGVTVFATDPDPAAQADAEGRGATTCPHPADLARRCDLVLVVVVDDKQTHEVVGGPAGLAAADDARFDVALCSSLRPATCREVADRLGAAAGDRVRVFDAAMVGGEQRAADGALTLFCGGPSEVVDRWRSTLAAVATRICHVGDIGAGQAAKAINNALMMSALLADAEALEVARAAGLDLSRLRPALCLGTGANQALVDWGTHRLRFPHKDLEGMLLLADEHDVPVPFFDSLRARLDGLTRERLDSLR